MTTTEPKTLMQAVSEYMRSSRAKADSQVRQQGLQRFINWCGGDKQISALNASQIGDFVERHNGMGTSLQSAARLQEVRKFLTFARKKGLIEVNLAQHVRIRKSKTAGAGKVASNANVVELTAEGHAQIESQLTKLKAERVPLTEQISSAAADGDVRENAPLEAAREQLGYLEGRINDMEATLKASVIIDSSGRKTETVVLGSKVVIRDPVKNSDTTYVVVRANEASPLEGKISDVSPVGQALVGARAGQKVQVQTPRGKVAYEVLKIN